MTNDGWVNVPLLKGSSWANSVMFVYWKSPKLLAAGPALMIRGKVSGVLADGLTSPSKMRPRALKPTCPPGIAQTIASMSGSSCSSPSWNTFAALTTTMVFLEFCLASAIISRSGRVSSK